jgi:hypothetical protein
MPSYPFTGPVPRVFPICHGPGVRVDRHDDDPYEHDDPDGASVLLRPGDVLVLDTPIGFAHPELDGSTAEPAVGIGTESLAGPPSSPSVRRRATASATDATA